MNSKADLNCSRGLRLAASVAALCGVLAMPATAAAGTQTFSATADARVEQAYPSSNHGRSSTLRVDGATDPGVETYLRFSVSGLTGAVQRARLRLYATSGTVVKPVAFVTSAGWTEGGITWSNRPARTVALPVSTGGVAQGTWAEFDVTPAVSSEGTFNFVLATTSKDGLNLASRESSSPRPQLVVDVAAGTLLAPTATATPTSTPTTAPTSPPSGPCAVAGVIFCDDFNGVAGSPPDPAKWEVYSGSNPSHWGVECFTNQPRNIQ